MPSRLITRIAPDVGWLPVSFTNVYFIGRPGGKWGLVDTGFPGRARESLGAAAARLGSGWEWVRTPGHSPGHICLFRPSDRVLLTGDALVSVNMDSWVGLIGESPQLAGPPAPFTIDWDLARRSLKELANLRPNVLGCGH